MGLEPGTRTHDLLVLRVLETSTLHNHTLSQITTTPSRESYWPKIELGNTIQRWYAARTVLIETTIRAGIRGIVWLAQAINTPVNQRPTTGIKPARYILWRLSYQRVPYHSGQRILPLCTADWILGASTSKWLLVLNTAGISWKQRNVNLYMCCPGPGPPDKRI